LIIEYDPKPPFDSGSIAKAEPSIVELAKHAAQHAFKWTFIASLSHTKITISLRPMSWSRMSGHRMRGEILAAPHW